MAQGAIFTKLLAIVYAFGGMLVGKSFMLMDPLVSVKYMKINVDKSFLRLMYNKFILNHDAYIWEK